jgi:threonine synthase
VKFVSTRGIAESCTFEDAVLAGLASDGGLYVPEELPHFSVDTISSWSQLTYEDLAVNIMYPFIEAEISKNSLEAIIKKSYSVFRNSDIAPMLEFRNNNWILELFHGPTLAFKDFALQFLGNLLDHIVESREEKLVVLGATSGDTGSAAIEGCQDCRNIDIFILHPHNRVSEVQRRQMTTIKNKNVHNIAINGNFDDCQAIVKKAFSNQSFLKGERRLIAVNSINFARILAQIVYYFWSYLRVGCPKDGIVYSVPTGNFGDVYAGYLALKMGLPVKKLLVATNSNDILHRCINNNDHSPKKVNASLAPSMDIMISSNFERLLFDAYERDANLIRDMMKRVSTQTVMLTNNALSRIRENFWSYRSSDDEIVEMIRAYFKNFNYTLDPHTAIGMSASLEYRKSCECPIVTLATADPSKFPDISNQTFLERPELPPHLQSILKNPEYFSILNNSQLEVENFIIQKIFD